MVIQRLDIQIQIQMRLEFRRTDGLSNLHLDVIAAATFLIGVRRRSKRALGVDRRISSVNDKCPSQRSGLSVGVI